jgi:glycosyltransferase involved in cell wall biosynthesis
MYKLTIIIPVYNRERTIKRALNSIVNQLDETTEIVIVNDGSTDKTGEVIKEYIDSGIPNIKYYAKVNEGVASARNFGITNSNGEYIMFVDSDDYVDNDFIKELQTYLYEDIDIIKFKAKHVDESGNVISKIGGPVFGKLSGEEAFNKLAFTDILMDSPCVYLFKKDLFTKNNMYFKVGTYHEDFGLIPLILLKAKSVISINTYGYNYVQTDNSITRNADYKKTVKRFEDALLHYDNMIQFVNENDLQKNTNQNVKQYYTNAILLKLKSISKEERKYYIEQIKQRKMIQNIKPKNIKQVLKRLILSFNINWYLKCIK